MLDPEFCRRLIRAFYDCGSWVAATLLVAVTRYEFTLNAGQWFAVVIYLLCACALQLILGTVLMLYRGRYPTASFEESLGLAVTAFLVGFSLGTVFVGLIGEPFPRATAVLSPPIALLLMAAGRWAYRAWNTRGALSRQGAERVLVYGAGDAGHQLIRSIAADPSAPYHVVGLIDDARAKRNLRLLGVPVLGTRTRLASIAEEQDASTVILAMPQANAELVREVSDLVEDAGLKLLVLPPVGELVGGRVSMQDVREVNIADILGRHQIDTDLHEIASYLTGRCVMVTGAGGSIGSELARQVHRFGPSELVLLDRDESALHGVQLSIYGKGLLDTDDMVLADIRDEEALEAIFDRHRPDVVLHAAALKHLPMLEQYPEEGWKTNVMGTLNVLRMSQRFGCSRFVNISTDKAATPTSVLGRTKRIAEQLTSWYASRSTGTYLSVRFGNVLGSRGSMLHTFTTQIEAGGPVTVTHPEVTRYFMTVPEACELTIQAAAIGEAGEVLVLDMGEPIRILDVAERLIAQSERDVAITFTGLRPGEKMHEVLFSQTERGEHRHHPLISHVPVPPFNPADLGLAKTSLRPSAAMSEPAVAHERGRLSVVAGHGRH